MGRYTRKTLDIFTKKTAILAMVHLRKNLEDIAGKHSIDSLQNTAILAMVHVRKNLEDIAGKHSIDSLQNTAILAMVHVRKIWKV